MAIHTKAEIAARAKSMRTHCLDSAKRLAEALLSEPSGNVTGLLFDVREYAAAAEESKKAAAAAGAAGIEFEPQRAVAILSW
ncbi:MAG: hypothetical protein KGL39_28965 [Patescibacteria group bacterium]|nr:hypothetical protein [Patescibacteria group bacterium]